MDEPDDQGPPVELSEDETAVMLGTFAGASLSELSSSIGLPVDRLSDIVTRLTRLGLIEPQLIPLEPEEPERRSGSGDRQVARGERDPLGAAAAADPPSADEGLVALLEGALDGLAVPARAAAGPSPAAGAGEAPVEPPAAAASPRRTPAVRPSEPSPPAPEEPVVALPVDEPAAEGADETREYQKLYETELHPLPADERTALARTETGPRLFALCFDREPKVIHALFENTAATAEHARLVALHHRTVHGLGELLRRTALISDPLVHRRLVRNPALDEAGFRRLMGGQRLLAIYKVSLDRDVPERSRAAARTLFRNKFSGAAAEERVEIVWATEGRVLMAMTGLTFDARTTALLCTRTYASIMLIQSLARFSATPPPLIAHLLRQPLVKRQAHLKNLLLQHPNTPADAKRRL